MWGRAEEDGEMDGSLAGKWGGGLERGSLEADEKEEEEEREKEDGGVRS